MWNWFKSFAQRWLQDNIVIATTDGGTVPVSETYEGKLFAAVAQRHCVVCGKNEGFHAGSEGGMSMNVQCAHCGYWYNVTPVIQIAEKIGYKDAGRAEPWWPDL